MANDRPGWRRPIAPLDGDERSALIAAHQRQLQLLRESPQYRLGHLLFASMRSVRVALRLPAELWRLGRDVRAMQRASRRPSTAPVGQPVTPRLDVRVATILDEFTTACLTPEVSVVPLTRAWGRELDAQPPAFLFAESAWEGSHGAWKYAMSNFATRGAELRDLVEAVRARGVPTVFWNKEDPVHFERFLPVARLFDHVFTTDSDRVPAYRDALGHDRVSSLPFAAQPRLHHPDGRARDRADRACFAGSWRGDEYGERSEAATMLLRPLVATGRLDIFDRMLAPGATGHPFPPPYDAAVRGWLSYDEMVLAYRRYGCFLNINSVVESPTMCARRVFELLACRTPVVSGPSVAIEQMFGDVVTIVEHESHARAVVERLLDDVVHRDRVAQRGYRVAMSRHTYRHRLDDVLDAIGLDVRRPAPTVSVVCATRRPERLGELLDGVARQAVAGLQVVLVEHGVHLDRHLIAGCDIDVELITASADRTLGECLNAGLARASGRFVAKFDDDDHYGPNYLLDALMAFQFTDAALVGKKSFYAYLADEDRTVLRFPGHEFAYVDRVSGATFLIDRERWSDVRFPPVPSGVDSMLLDECRRLDLGVYSTDRFNFAAERRADAQSHTWTIDRREFLESAVGVGTGRCLDHVEV
jgi:spore maturation protein CgeB